jgi:aminoglycoside phosphotransferase (APT) family kinase protein
VRSSGTVNAIYRLGDDKSVRLPLVDWGVGDADREGRWLPVLAPQLPLEIPAQVAVGTPGAGYPFPWSIHRWIDGEPATLARLADPVRAAADLAHFIAALRRLDPAGAPAGRGGPLAARQQNFRNGIEALHGSIDADAAAAVWKAAVRAPDYDGPPVWTHSDLFPSNLLVRRGRLCAVIDFAIAGVGDPAVDLLPAWTFFTGESRDAFRAALDADDAAWARSRGYALLFGLAALPYYRITNPEFAAVARHTIDTLLAS